MSTDQPQPDAGSTAAVLQQLQQLYDRLPPLTCLASIFRRAFVDHGVAGVGAALG